MKEINIEELKLIQLDILTAVDEFCKEYNINYSLSSGTLIGAVRHQGYIPWDDDIDIMMSRKDYNRFVETFNGHYKHLSLLAPELNKDYYAPYANVFDNRTLLKEGCNGHRGLNIGVKIDVFPIDYVAEDLEEYTKDMNEVNNIIQYKMYIKRLEKLSKSGFSLKRLLKIYVYKCLYYFVKYSDLQSSIINIATNKKNINSKYVDNIVFNIYYKKNTRYRRDVIEHYIRLPFEGREYSVVRDYDEVLSNTYGDYMQLPPEDQRVARHDFEAYWIE